MLKTPNEYQLSKISLSNRTAKIDDLLFDSAIIFFTPKVADKGVDLTGLVCTIVQIIDRGAWGKEEVPFTVDASSITNRKYREFDLTVDAPYSLKITPPPELRMGILEIYFDPTINTNMANLNNPNQPIDFSPLVAAIENGSAAQVMATETAAADSEKKVTNFEEMTYKPTLWGGVPTNHIVVRPNDNRVGVSIFNKGTSGNVIVDLFQDLRQKTAESQEDAVIQPGGTYTLSDYEATLGLLLYTKDGNPNSEVNINFEYSFPTAPVSEPSA